MAEPSSDVASNVSEESATDYRTQIREAIAEIRWEGRKAAFIHATVDTVAAMMLTNLALSLFDAAMLERTVGPPVSVNQLLGLYLGIPSAIPPIRYGTLAAIAIAPLVFAGELLWLLRRPLVERFEMVNPAVHEALRTARDAIRRDVDGPIAQALYADVIDRLGQTSSIGLLNVARITIALGLILGAGLAAVQVSIVGFEVDLAGTDGADATDPATETTRTPEPEGLQSGDAVLGESTNVTSGSENLSAEIAASAGGRGTETRSYGSGSSAGSASGVDSQRAGYAQPEEVEDAELIREYARRVAAQDQEETSDNE